MAVKGQTLPPPYRILDKESRMAPNPSSSGELMIASLPSSSKISPDAAAESSAENPSRSELPKSDGERALRNRREERERQWAVFLYALTTILLFADQNLLAPNLTAVADEFGFSDEERDTKLGGHIALAFFLLGAPASFVVGCLADSMSRAPLFAVTVCIGEGACMATYWTSTYGQLFVTRALTGFSVGGALPLISSVLGDLYESHERPAVMAIVGMGTGVGIALGQGVAGFLGPTYGWRLPFLVVSVPAMMCSIIVLVTVRDPERGGKERAVLERTGGVESSRLLEGLQDVDGAADGVDASSESDNVPVNIEMSSDDKSSLSGAGEKQSISSLQTQSPAQTFCAEALSGNVGDSFKDDEISYGQGHGSTDRNIASSENESCFGILSQLLDWRAWASHLHTFISLLNCRTVLLTLVQGAPGCIPWGIVNTYLNDYLSENRGMTVEGATLTILAFGFGNFLGMCVGGLGGNMLYKIDPRYPNLMSGAAAILGCIPMWVLINTVDASSSVVYTVSASVLAGLGSGVTGPIVKATLQNTTLPNTRGQAFALLNTFDDFGRGLGPVFVAMLITSMGARTPAFNVGVIGWVFCGMLNVLMYFTVKKDEDMIQVLFSETLQQGEEEMEPSSTPKGNVIVAEDVSPSSSEPNGKEKADEAPLL